jgi:hypothetical protein
MALTGIKQNASLRVLGNIYSNESIYQQAVLDRQTDATLDPGASPATGARYIIEDSAALHANFGTISGIGNDDIVEYDGTDFVVVWDASAQGAGACTYDQDVNSSICFNGTAWQTADHPGGGDGMTFNAGQNRFDLDLGNTNPGLELTASDGSGELQLSTQGNGIAGGAGSLLSIDQATEVAGSRAQVYLGADGVGIDLDNSTLDHSTSILQVKALGIDTAQLAALAVTNAKIAADAIDSTKIADNAIGNEHMQDNSIDTLELADSAVETAKINNLAVTTAKIAADAIDATKVADNAIGNEHLQDNAVDTAELAANAVTTIKITDLNVTTAKIAADAVDGTKIADDAVDSEHLAADAVDADALDHASLKMRSGALTDPFTSSLTITFTHYSSTTDVMVELHDVTTGELCMADYTKTANAVVITMNQTPTNSVRVLIREIDPAQTTIVAS